MSRDKPRTKSYITVTVDSDDAYLTYQYYLRGHKEGPPGQLPVMKVENGIYHCERTTHFRHMWEWPKLRTLFRQAGLDVVNQRSRKGYVIWEPPEPAAFPD